MEDTAGRASSARAWLLARGFIHPKNLVLVDTMVAQVKLLDALIQKTENDSLLTACIQWKRVWLRKLDRENMEFGIIDGRHTGGRSQSKRDKAEQSREVRNNMKGRKG